ncbi:MAG: efflux RND transporter periplasmic adaptor subunit [Verrucomicrobiota bacterium]
MKVGAAIKTVLVLGVIGVGAFYYVRTLKPEALVAAVKEDVAAHAVPGTLTVLPRVAIDLKSEHDGRIIESSIEVGEIVKKGQLLVRLDTSELEINLDRDRAVYEAAVKKAEIRNPREYDLDKAKEALEDAELSKSTLSVSQFENLKKNITRIEEQLRRDKVDTDLRIAELKSKVLLLERQIENMSIVSPIDGIVSPVYAYEGDWIHRGQQIARVVSLNSIVEVKVSEENFAGLEVGQRARVKFLGYGVKEFSATVSKIIDVAETETQRYPLHLEVDIDPRKLYPGLTGEASITIDEREKALVIPRQALEGDKVYVVEGGVVSVRQVEKGYISLTNAEVRDGLELGDQVIVENLELFSEGDEVRTSLINFY